MLATATDTTIRADALLLTRGRNQEDDILAVAAGLLLDGALAGALEVTGRRRLGVDLRRVRPGAATPADPLLADLRRRIDAVSPDTPKGWLERAMVYAPDLVRDQLLAALAGLLCETELFGRANGGPPSRRESRALDAAIAGLPHAARAILATLAEIRRHNDGIGGWYADD